MDQDLIHYQAANQTDDEAIENFVVRQEDFNKVINDIKNTEKDSSFQHYIFVGRRGSGKSTLLRRIEAEINKSEKLKKDYEVVNLGEEQSGIYKLHDLWDNVIRDLNAKGYKIEEVDFRDYREDLKGYSKKLHAQIIAEIRAKKKKRLILLVDNIDRIFKNIGEDSDLFRELLMNYLDIRIIGGSTYMSEQFWKYEKSFYQFFTIRQLGPLSMEEIKSLFTRWSKVKNLPEIEETIRTNPGKLQSIRMLTDGTPRSMLILVDMLLKRPSLNGYDYLKAIVDKATPIYQERLGTLSPAQNKVITELSYFWEASRVKDLIPKCKMESKVISALLNQLSKLHYVEKLKGDTKDLYYRIEERFFNLWLIMTQGGPQQKHEAKYLTEFIETWYNQKEINRLCHKFSLDIDTDRDNIKRLIPMSHALLNAKSLSKENKLALYSKLKNELKVSDSEIGAAELYLGDLNPEIEKAFEEQKYRKAIDLLKVSNLTKADKYFGIGLAYYKLKEFDESEKNYLLSIKNGGEEAVSNLAILYEDQARYEKAEEYYLEAIDKGDRGALYNLADLYGKQERYEEAEKYYLEAIDKEVIDALNNLAILYQEQERYEESEKYYLKAIDKGDIKAFNNLANLYEDQECYEESEKYYLEAIDKGVVEALYNLANLYKEQERYEESEKYYLEAIDKGDIRALNNLANLYEDQERYEESEKYYLEAIEKGVVEALYNLAILYRNQERYEESEKYYLEAIDKGDIKALNNLASLYEDQERYEKSEKYYLEAIDKGVVEGQNNLLNMYYLNQNKNKVQQLLSTANEATQQINIELLSVCYLYIGEMDLFKSTLDEITHQENFDNISNQYLIHLLIHNQLNLIEKLFIENQILQEKYKPLFYATLRLKGSKSEITIKIPPELQDNIDDILLTIKEERKKFYRKKK